MKAQEVTIEVPENSTLYNTYTTSILMMYSVIELIDELKNTNMYRHEVKQQLNRAIDVINTPTFIEKLNACCEDFDALKNMTDHYRQLFSRLVKLNPSLWAALDEIVYKLNVNPELTMALLNMNHGSSTELELMLKKEALISDINILGEKQIETVSKYINNVLLPNA